MDRRSAAIPLITLGATGVGASVAPDGATALLAGGLAFIVLGVWALLADGLRLRIRGPISATDFPHRGAESLVNVGLVEVAVRSELQLRFTLLLSNGRRIDNQRYLEEFSRRKLPPGFEANPKVVRHGLTVFFLGFIGDRVIEAELEGAQIEVRKDGARSTIATIAVPGHYHWRGGLGR